MTPTMERPVIVPFRWPAGRKLDIRTCIVGEQLLFSADDICKALDAHVKERHDILREKLLGRVTRDYPAPTVTAPTVLDDDGLLVEFFTIDIVRALADERPLYADDNGFLDWFEDLVEQLSGDRLRAFVAGAVHPEPGLKAEETYSVARAARLLSNDLLLSFGQQSLFAALEQLGWITREHERWVAVDERLAMGHLARLETKVGPLQERYVQVRITPDGLEVLRAKLRELVPTLVEL